MPYEFKKNYKNKKIHGIIIWKTNILLNLWIKLKINYNQIIPVNSNFKKNILVNVRELNHIKKVTKTYPDWGWL